MYGADRQVRAFYKLGGKPVGEILPVVCGNWRSTVVLMCYHGNKADSRACR